MPDATGRIFKLARKVNGRANSCATTKREKSDVRGGKQMCVPICMCVCESACKCVQSLHVEILSVQNGFGKHILT